MGFQRGVGDQFLSPRAGLDHITKRCHVNQRGDHCGGGIERTPPPGHAPGRTEIGQLPAQDRVGIRFAFCDAGRVDPRGQFDRPPQ